MIRLFFCSAMWCAYLIWGIKDLRGIRFLAALWECKDFKNYEEWTHWGLSPGPSACGADVIPLHHVPDDNSWNFRINLHMRCEIIVRRWVFDQVAMMIVLQDTLAEWLRRRPAKPMGSPCVGSNPTGVDLLQSSCERISNGGAQSWQFHGAAPQIKQTTFRTPATQILTKFTGH